MKYLAGAAVTFLLSVATVPRWATSPDFQSCGGYFAASLECGECLAANADLCLDWVTRECTAAIRNVCANQLDQSYDKCEQQVRADTCLDLELAVCRPQLRADRQACLRVR